MDNDLSSTSRQLTAKIAASPFFIVKPTLQNQPNADESLKSSITDAVIVIPQGFEKKLVRENKTDIQLLINGAAVSSAAVVNGYLTAIIQEFNKDAFAHWPAKSNQTATIFLLSLHFGLTRPLNTASLCYQAFWLF